MKLLRIVLLAVCSLFTQTIFAQDGSEVSVGEIHLPNLRWGSQQANLEVTNKTEYLKFISVVTTISFSDSYFKPIRKARTNFILGPLESKILTPWIFVPGNYGKAAITVQLYDVVDTADILLPRQKFFEQPITIQYHAPDPIMPYVSQRVTLPPIVDRSGNWDSEISRLMLILLREKKSISEIAKMTDADEKYVKSIADALVAETALKQIDSSYEPTFAVILESEVEQYRPLAEQLSDSLALLVEQNMGAFRTTRDSLVKGGVMSADTTDFMNPGGVLFREYPTIAGLFLWDFLGKAFVTERKNFTVFDGTDFCNAFTPFYMYAVQGGDNQNGHHFFSVSANDATIDFADNIPGIVCEEFYRQKLQARKPVSWQFAKGESSEGFVYSSFVTDFAMRSLGPNADNLISWAKTQFAEKTKTTKFQNFAFGPKYWFWNWTATMALDKLVKKGIVTRRGNGHYLYQAI
jgi:hypothetical protein